MARSPLTLAASVTSALPDVEVTGVGPLTEGGAGRFDSAVTTLSDGRRVAVRMPVDADADAELAAEIRALRALTPGVRAVLPFGAPDVVGETVVDGMHTVVQSLLPGYRVDAAHIPAGPGVGTAVAQAIAGIHDLPTSVVRDGGLAIFAPAQVRDGAERLLDRAEATGRLPFGLLRRWSTAIGFDPLWRFESTVTLGGVDPSSFTLTDQDDIAVVSGLLSWGGLSVSDPAVDLRWTASAPAAREGIFVAYAQASHRAPDALIRERARLYAELEFAKWLIHGHATGAQSVISDAVALLESLDESVRDEPLVEPLLITADDAIQASSRIPDAGDEAADTSMHTDTYDAGDLDFTEEPSHADIETEPIDLDDWTVPAPQARSAAPLPQRAGEAEEDANKDANEDTNDGDHLTSAENTLRRWSESA